MFTKPVEFSSLLYAEVASDGVTNDDGDELAQEGVENDVECKKNQVQIAFSIAWVVGRGIRNSVGYKKKRGDWIGETWSNVWGQ